MSIHFAISRAVLPILFLGGLLALVPAAAQPPKIGVSQTRFEVAIDGPPTTESFRVFNYSDEPMAAEVTVHNWDFDEDNRTRILPPTERSLDQWMVLNPVRFTVPAKGSQVVRFSIRPRLAPLPGEHRAMIYLTSRPNEEKGRSVRFNVRLGIAVYGYAGEVVRRGTLHGAEADGSGMRLDISSEGTAHLRLGGRWAVWTAGAYPIIGAALPSEGDPPPGSIASGALEGKPVLPGTRRWIVVPFDVALEPGDYVLVLDGTIGDTAVVRTTRFSVTAPPPPAATD